MGIRAKSPPPRSSAAKAFAQDRSLSPFKKSENAVGSPSKKSQLDSAYSGVQDKFWLLAFIASFVVFFALEATGVLTAAQGSRSVQQVANGAENVTFLYVKYMFNNHLPPYLCAVLVMSGVLSLFFLVVKFFARPIIVCVYLGTPFACCATCAYVAYHERSSGSGLFSLMTVVFLFVCGIVYQHTKEHIERTAAALSNATDVMCQPVHLLQFMTFQVVLSIFIGIWANHLFSLLNLKDLALSNKLVFILLHQYWITTTITGITYMIAGRVAATRYLNKPTNVWHCICDVVIHGAGTASGLGIMLAPFKLLDMIFKRAHQLNRLVWSYVPHISLPFELEFSIAFIVFWYKNQLKNAWITLKSLDKGAFASSNVEQVWVPLLTSVVLFGVVLTVMYKVQSFVTWFLEQFHKMTAYVAGIGCCDLFTAKDLAIQYIPHHMSHCCSHFGNIRSIAEYSATAVKVKSFTFLAFLLLLVPTMHVTSYVTNNFHPCLRHSTPFDLLLGQASSCTWFEFWAHPETAYQRFACFFSIAIGVLIFNYLMLRTLFDIVLCTVMCDIMDGKRKLTKDIVREDYQEIPKLKIKATN